MSTTILERPVRRGLGECDRQGEVAASSDGYYLMAKRQELVGDYTFTVQSFADNAGGQTVDELVSSFVGGRANRTVARRRS